MGTKRRHRSTSPEYRPDEYHDVTGAAPAMAGSALTSHIWNAYKQVAYLTPDGHVHELCCNAAGQWTHADLNDVVLPPPFAPADPAANGSALTSYSWGASKQVVYFTPDGHVHEFCYTP